MDIRAKNSKTEEDKGQTNDAGLNRNDVREVSRQRSEGKLTIEENRRSKTEKHRHGR